jgi:hypothetical protein
MQAWQAGNKGLARNEKIYFFVFTDCFYLTKSKTIFILV